MVKYSKTEVLKQLRDAEAAVERSLKTHEEAFQEWKENAPKKFAEWVDSVGISDTIYSANMDAFRPPVKHEACRDYRIQNLNRCILRVTAMATDDYGIISVRPDDELWGYVGLAACL